MKKNQKLRRQNRYGDPIDMKIILNEKKAFIFMKIIFINIQKKLTVFLFSAKISLL
jgi:hypothetical protein